MSVKEKSSFQIIVTGVFVFFIVAGVIAFSIGGGTGGKGGVASAEIWGTVLQKDFDLLTYDVIKELGDVIDVTYREIRPEEFDATLIEALASGIGPDAILLSQDSVIRHLDKVFLIPYESLPERDFKDRFIEEGDLFLLQNGIVALPFSVDPLVMFWNRSLFSNAGVAQPPKYWDEFVGLAQRINAIDDSRNVLKSAVALGEFGNIKNAKDILTALIIQAGGSITSMTDENKLKVTFGDKEGLPESPVDSAVRFYTEFSNPVKPAYSWNRALPFSDQAFLAGDLAVYFGFAHELFELRDKNPNLNFDVAQLPQVRDGSRISTFGHIEGIAVMKSSDDVGSAIRVAGTLTGVFASNRWDEITGLPPVRRELLSVQPTDAFRGIFYKSALTADAFLDLDKNATLSIFRRMIEDVTSGRDRITGAVNRARAELNLLIQ